MQNDCRLMYVWALEQLQALNPAPAYAFLIPLRSNLSGGERFDSGQSRSRHLACLSAERLQEGDDRRDL